MEKFRTEKPDERFSEDLIDNARKILKGEKNPRWEYLAEEFKLDESDARSLFEESQKPPIKKPLKTSIEITMGKSNSMIEEYDKEKQRRTEEEKLGQIEEEKIESRKKKEENQQVEKPMEIRKELFNDKKLDELQKSYKQYKKQAEETGSPMWKDYVENIQKQIEKREKWLAFSRKPAKQVLKEIDLALGKKSKNFFNRKRDSLPQNKHQI